MAQKLKPLLFKVLSTNPLLIPLSSLALATPTRSSVTESLCHQRQGNYLIPATKQGHSRENSSLPAPQTVGIYDSQQHRIQFWG